MRAGLVALLSAVLLIGCAPAASVVAPVEAEHEAAPIHSIPVVEFTGAPAEIGQQHGEQLGPAIRSLLTDYLGRYFRSPWERTVAMGAAAMFEPYIRPEHKAEIAALADGAHVAPGEVMLAQCFLDLSAMTACSTVALPADASPDGVARLGRNLDFPGLDLADRHTIVRVYHPEGRYGYVDVGWPGMVGVLSGMNEHGLALANMEVGRARRMPSAMPYTLLYRAVLENCRTVDEAIDLLERTPRQSANNLMLMDASGERAVVEITPEGITVRQGTDGQALISTNHQRGQDGTSPGRCRRYDTLRRQSEQSFGLIERSDVQSMLRDVEQGPMTLQSMIFEPAERRLWLAAGTRAAERTMEPIHLRDYFPR